MTTTEANEFFAQRTVEVVGGDSEESDTHHKRLQTERPDTRVRGRIVVTLHYNLPRKTWLEHDTDAVDKLRRTVVESEDSIVDAETFGAVMKELYEAALSYDIEAAK